MMIFIFVISILFGGEPEKYKGDGYLECLLLHIDTSASDYGPVDTFYVEAAQHLGDYTGQYNNTYIQMVDSELLYKMTKKRKVLTLRQISPIEFEEGIPVIYIIDFGVSRRGDKYRFVKDRGSKFSMSADCVGDFHYEIVMR